MAARRREVKTFDVSCSGTGRTPALESVCIVFIPRRFLQYRMQRGICAMTTAPLNARPVVTAEPGIDNVIGLHGKCRHDSATMSGPATHGPILSTDIVGCQKINFAIDLSARKIAVDIHVGLMLSSAPIIFLTRMWANAQRDGRPVESRSRPLFNAAKFG